VARIPQSRRNKIRPARGAIAVLLACMLPLLLVAMVWAIDVSRMHLVRAELQVASDTAARAGTEALLRTGNPAAARQAAQRVAALHRVAGKPLEIAPEDVTLGRCVSQTDAPWQFVPGATPFNAVRVNGRRTADSRSGSVDLFVGHLLGATRFHPEQTAVAAQKDQEIALVLECSGSMHPKWDEALAVFSTLKQALRGTANRTSICLVQCKNAPTLRLDLTDANNSMDDLLVELQQELDEIKLTQARNLGEGILLASDTLYNASSGPLAEKKILFITSGNHNKGLSPIDAARIAAGRRQVLHSLLVGRNEDRRGMLTEAASITGGEVVDTDQAVELLRSLTRLVQTKSIVTTE
jgi:Flp pilus assembly protein TadG